MNQEKKRENAPSGIKLGSGRVAVALALVDGRDFLILQHKTKTTVTAPLYHVSRETIAF